jgi:hypothetical protein
MERSDNVENLIQLVKPFFSELTLDPRIPTTVSQEQLIVFIKESAPLLLLVFGSPLLASEGICELFEQIFSRLEHIQDSLNRIEEGVTRIEQKHDAGVLARFKSGYRELQDGIAAGKPELRERLILSARSKLTEIAELPLDLDYSGYASDKVAASACLLLVIADAWLGEFRSSLRYALKGLSCCPVWAEQFVPAALINSLAGERIKLLENDLKNKIKREMGTHHDFFWEKAACGAAIAGVVTLGLTGMGSGLTVGTAGLINRLNNLNAPDAQQTAQQKAISKFKDEALMQRSHAIKAEADLRLRDFDKFHDVPALNSSVVA